MINIYSITLNKIIDEYKLTNFTENLNISQHEIFHPEINRPALQLAGFYDYFDSVRMQLIGLVEYTYLEKLSYPTRTETFRKLFEYKIPVLVICRGLLPFPELIEQALLYNTPVLGYPGSTNELIGELSRWLKVQLAPRVTMHGVLVDVYGEGVLITGESGIGKSETALELIKRGHRLVADDAVEIRKVSSQTLVGSCPETIRYFIELRGVGIIDIRQMFGVQSIKLTQSVDLVIKLESWDNSKEYDRLGLHEDHMTILDNRVVCHLIPIRPGRNLAVICESAAINHRQKKMGYNAAVALQEKVMQNISKGESFSF